MTIRNISRRRFFKGSFCLSVGPLLSALPISSITGASDMESIAALLKQKKPLVWLFTGDSITQGAKHTHGLRSYPEIFEERIRWELSRRRDVVINTGISGNNTQSILDDFDWRVKEWRPSVVSMMIGTNDCASKGIPVDIFEHNLDVMLIKIRQIGAIPILHTPNRINEEHSSYPSRAKLPEYIEVIQNLAEKRKVILVDNWSYWRGTLETNPKANVMINWLSDPLHPNGKGHQEIARLMFKQLSIFDPKAGTCGD